MNCKNQLLVLRLLRIHHLPPALYATQILGEKGVPVTVFEFSGEDTGVKELHDFGLRIVRLGAKAPWLPSPLRSTYLVLRALLFLVKSFTVNGRPRAIVAHGVQEQWMALFLKRWFGIPYAAHVHEIYEASELSGFNRLLFSAEPQALREAAFTVFPSEERLEIYRQRYGLLKPAYLVCNVPRKRKPGPKANLKKELGFPEDSTLLTYLGGVSPANVIEEAIRALPMVPEVCLAVVGWGVPGFLNEMVAVVKALKLEKRVVFLAPTKDKWKWFDSSDIGYCIYHERGGIRFSHNATAGNKISEYISSGVPLLAGATPDFKQLVEPRGLGVCCEPTPESIAQGLKTLIAQKKNWPQISAKARAFHETEYHYEFQSKEIITHYQSWFETTGKDQRLSNAG